MKKTTKKFEVTYDKAIGTVGTIIVGANNEKEAINNARNQRHTGENFRNPILLENTKL